MSQYAQIADFELRITATEITQLSDNDESLLDAALERASREIDSYIAARYDVPVMTASTELLDYCLTIARYWLFSRNGQADADNVVTKDYLRVLGRLSEIQNSKKDLMGVPLKLQYPDDGLIVMDAAPRLFSR